MTTSKPSAPAAPTPVDADPVLAIAQLANTLGHASTVLFNYRRDNPAAPDLDQALNLEMALDQRTIDLRTQAIRLLGAQAASAVAQMQDAALRVDAYLSGVKAMEARLTLASAMLALASATLVGDAGGMLAAVVNVDGALRTVARVSATA